MRAVLAVLFLALSVLFAADVRYGTAALPGAPPRATLARVLGDGAPHPTGSAALAQVRARIAAILTEMGLPPTERTTIACGRYGTCARVTSLVVRVPGRDSTGTVAVVAHSDSVGASPGASDDGAGVAALLEVARAATRTPHRNDLLFAVLEGEELGLLGAEAFVGGDPTASEVRVVVNLEARGTRGPAQLFQTSRAGGALVRVATRGMARPVGSSLFASVYERMPNDTDLTVFLDHGYAGLNFAFSDGVEGYHTAHDDLAHQSEGSLAHLTESAMGSAFALADDDLRALRPESLVWFDVLGAFVVAWPASFSLPLASLALLGLLSTTFRLVRAGRVRASSLAFGLLAWLGTVFLCALFGLVVHATFHPPTPWIAHPRPLLLALFGAPLVLATLLSWALGERFALEGVALGVGLVHAVLGLVLAQALPGASYLFVAPSVVFALSSLALSRRPVLAVAAPALAGLFASVLPLRTLYPGLGMVVAPVISLACAPFVLPFAPLLSGLAVRERGRLSLALLAAFVACLGVAATRPAFSAEVTRRTNVIVAQQESSPKAMMMIDPTWAGTAWGEPPREMIAALGDDAREGMAFPWQPRSLWTALLPRLDLPAPEAEILEGSRASGRARIRLRTRRDARTLVLIIPPGAGLVHADLEGAIGVTRTFTHGLPAGYRGIRFEGMSEVVLSCSFGPGTAPLHVLDATDGLPEPARKVAAARPATALPAQDGDRTLAFRGFLP